MNNLDIIKDFPEDFIFGTATSSYQIEGSMYGGCGLSHSLVNTTHLRPK